MGKLTDSQIKASICTGERFNGRGDGDAEAALVPVF